MSTTTFLIQDDTGDRFEAEYDATSKRVELWLCGNLVHAEREDVVGLIAYLQARVEDMSK